MAPFSQRARQGFKWSKRASIRDALQRNHGFEGSYSSVRRFVRKLVASLPNPIVRLQFQAGEVAQVDFGSGPLLPYPVTGRPRKSHFFVMSNDLGT